MKYMGSKSRVKKHIVPILQKVIDDNEITDYIEPFVGGANVIDSIVCKNSTGVDNHKYLIALLVAIKNDCELPKEVSKEHYDEVRDCFNNQDDTFEDWYVGAIGFLSSYNGRFFDGGYSGKRTVGTGKVRDYYAEAVRNIEKQREHIKHIDFIYADYRELNVPKGALVYCDIPYKGTKKYSTSKDFDYDVFWDWVREISEYATVIVSEQQAPSDFKAIWEQEVSRTIDNNKRVRATEKLFIYDGDINE